MKSFLRLLSEKGVTEIRNTLTSLYARYNDVYVSIDHPCAGAPWHMHGGSGLCRAEPHAQAQMGGLRERDSCCPASR